MNDMRIHALIAVSVLALAGCNKTQTFGGEMRKVRYKNIVSLSPSTTEILAMNGIQIMGRTKACNYPEATVSGVTVYGDIKPDYEKITNFGPDLIILDKDLYSDEEVKKLEATGAKVHQFSAKNLDGYVKEVYKIASLVGSEMNFQSFIDRMRREKKNAEADSPNPRPTAVLVLPGQGGSHYIAGTKSFQAEVMKAIGVDLIGPDSEKFEPLNPEMLTSNNPGVIVVAGKTSDFLADRRFASLDAIKNLRIFGLDADVVLRKGGRVDTFLLQGHKALSIVSKKK
jgi:iron complex transport system substrate-binding protein